VPLYSSLPQDEQVKAFHSGDKRMYIVATNIAETSLTIEGVAHVVGKLANSMLSLQMK